jgi:hypothetical protein
MNKWTELLIGLILLIAAILVWYYTIGIGTWDFGTAAWQVLKGGVIWGMIGLGLLFLILGISDLKN